MPETGCSDECSHNREAAETRSSTPEMPAVSAFFSLAALAEVAAMENVHRLAVGSLAALGHGWHHHWPLWPLLLLLLGGPSPSIHPKRGAFP